MHMGPERLSAVAEENPVSELADQVLRSHPKPRAKDRARVIGGLVVAAPVGVYLLGRYGLSRLGARRRDRG
jgi:hypothetical protein